MSIEESKDISATVCDVHVAYLRKNGYDNLDEFMKDPSNVYIGRKGVLIYKGRRFPEKDSIWANPFKVGKHGDLETVIEKYREHIMKKIKEENLWEELYELINKRLGCWCVKGWDIDTIDKPVCHGQILLEILRSPQTEDTAEKGVILNKKSQLITALESRLNELTMEEDALDVILNEKQSQLITALELKKLAGQGDRIEIRGTGKVNRLQ